MYKPFKGTKIVCDAKVLHDDYEVVSSFYNVDKHKNRLPKFFDSTASALYEIASLIKDRAKEVVLHLKTENELFYPDDFVIANADLDKDGKLYIYFPPDGENTFEDDVLYEGSIINLIK